MGIGAIGSMSFQPYIYNANTVSGSSLGRVQPIPDDLTNSKTDFTSLVEDTIRNENPLQEGETANFEEMVDMQMQMARNNAARIFGEDMAIAQ